MYMHVCVYVCERTHETIINPCIFDRIWPYLEIDLADDRCRG